MNNIVLSSIFLILASLAPVAGFAKGPSFDCLKAASDVEKAICADPAMASTDAAIAKRYDELMGTLSFAAAKALKDDQQWFIGVRDEMLGDNPLFKTRDEKLEAMAGSMKSRADFLYGIEPRKAGDFTGVWMNNAGGVEVSAEGGKYEAGMNAVDPRGARWVCDFAGTGEIKANEQILSTKSESSATTFNLSREGELLVVKDVTEGGSEVCGMNGSLEGAYFPINPDFVKKLRTEP